MKSPHRTFQPLLHVLPATGTQREQKKPPFIMSPKRLSKTKDQLKQRKKQKQERISGVPGSESQNEQEVSHASREKVGTSAPVSPLFHKQNLFITVSLLPGSLGHVLTHVEEAMRSFLLKYTAGVGGILLAFEDLELTNNGRGRILGELPNLHYDVECSALVFRPAVGVELDGRVVETFDSHVSIIVHQYFNASITARHLRAAGFRYDQTDGKWVHSESDKELSNDFLVRFTIERVHESGTL